MILTTLSFYSRSLLSFSLPQQLNFYAFRKIKYADTIRIDPKLEAETANYWRFRHEKFQRGKPELLGEIKRMNGQKQSSSTPKTPPAVKETLQENSALKTEVSHLKERVEAMTKNIDDLTSMVQKVTLVAAQPQQQGEHVVNHNNKRFKQETPLKTVPQQPQVATPSPVLPDPALSATPASIPEGATMDLEDASFFMPPSLPSPMPVDRTISNTSDLSDDGFVDQLFTAFKTEEVFDFENETESFSSSLPPTLKNKNTPRPELMERLGDALANLPRDIQELIVDRLIQAITSPKEIQDNISAANCLKENMAIAPKPSGGKALPSAVPLEKKMTSEEQKPMGLPLAAATLAALLSQYGGENNTKPSAANKDHKALLIPVHA